MLRDARKVLKGSSQRAGICLHGAWVPTHDPDPETPDPETQDPETQDHTLRLYLSTDRRLPLHTSSVVYLPTHSIQHKGWSIRVVHTECRATHAIPVMLVMYLGMYLSTSRSLVVELLVFMLVATRGLCIYMVLV